MVFVIIMSMLTVKETMTLELERTWWQRAGAKDAAIRELFGESPTRYYQRLNALIDTAEAWEYAPLVVKRLRRLRAARTAQRGARFSVEGIAAHSANGAQTGYAHPHSAQ